PRYEGVFVFDNDFAALRPDTPDDISDAENGLLVARAESGLCRVVCFSPRHDLTLAGLSDAQVCSVVDVWTEQYAELSSRPEIGHVQIFGNRGAMMGCSNPRPHGQIWAQRSVPVEVTGEGLRQAAHLERRGRTLLSDYAELEVRRRERVVLEEDSVVVVVPYWAVWPFETMVIPRRPVPSLPGMSQEERADLARALRR